MSQFEVGKSYQKPGYCFKITILKRTEKFITFREYANGELNPFQSAKGERKKVFSYQGKESVCLCLCEVTSEHLVD